MQFLLNDAEQTEALGACLWQALPAKCLMYLYGDLGMGKTTLIRGLLRAAGHQGVVRSPTYSLVEEYQFDNRRVFHFDLYRLKEPEELEWMGMSDYLAQSALCCIEWPQMGVGYLPAADLALHFQAQGQGRQLEIRFFDIALKNSFEVLFKNNHLLL